VSCVSQSNCTLQLELNHLHVVELSHFYTHVEKWDVLCYGVVQLAGGGDLQFSRLFFAIFAAIGLKLGILLCSQELLFQYMFRCDWLLFARVTPLELSRISDFFTFPVFFPSTFAAIWLKLGVLLCSQEVLFQLSFRCDWLIFARVTPLELSRFFQFFGLFPPIFAAIGLKLGVLLCSQELLFQFAF
jgi:hypothetical protein